MFFLVCILVLGSPLCSSVRLQHSDDPQDRRARGRSLLGNYPRLEDQQKRGASASVAVIQNSSRPQVMARGYLGSGVAGNIPIPACGPNSRCESAVVMDVGNLGSSSERDGEVHLLLVAQQSRQKEGYRGAEKCKVDSAGCRLRIRDEWIGMHRTLEAAAGGTVNSCASGFATLLVVLGCLAFFRPTDYFRGCQGGGSPDYWSLPSPTDWKSWCEPGSIPRPVHSGFLQEGIVPDDAAGRRVFSGISRFSLPSFRRCALQSPHFRTLIGSQDLDVKSRPRFTSHRVHCSVHTRAASEYTSVKHKPTAAARSSDDSDEQYSRNRGPDKRGIRIKNPPQVARDAILVCLKVCSFSRAGEACLENRDTTARVTQTDKAVVFKSSSLSSNEFAQIYLAALTPGLEKDSRQDYVKLHSHRLFTLSVDREQSIQPCRIACVTAPFASALRIEIVVSVPARAAGQVRELNIMVVLAMLVQQQLCLLRPSRLLRSKVAIRATVEGASRSSSALRARHSTGSAACSDASQGGYHVTSRHNVEVRCDFEQEKGGFGR
ncbi:hypothetical protein PR048_010630 [Dryococelus australis]|uniref:Uncharacterized protein n=1 Tax=Dryococelus australis TaxID=614101 RepID=A0ABQ9I388_9NEOP|nr:hypothetical protein PR048_010630 [Dryococelus australis]